MTQNKMAEPGGSINLSQEGGKMLAINVKEGWRECRRVWRTVVRRPIRRENIPEEEEGEENKKKKRKGKKEKEACVLYRTVFRGMIWTTQSRRGILEYNILLDISSSTSVPSICYPLNLLGMP